MFGCCWGVEKLGVVFLMGLVFDSRLLSVEVEIGRRFVVLLFLVWCWFFERKLYLILVIFRKVLFVCYLMGFGYFCFLEFC